MSRVDIVLLPFEHIEQIRPLLSRCVFKPYRFLAKDTPEEIDDYWFSEIVLNAVRDNNGQAFIAREKETITGLAVYADLPWDSKVFARRMGAIKALVVDPAANQQDEVANSLFSHAVNWASTNRIDFLMAKTQTDDTVVIRTLERQGFQLVDTLLDYVYDARRYPLAGMMRPDPARGVNIRLAEPGDTEELVELGKLAFKTHFGRYHSDSQLPGDGVAKVYGEWARSSAAGYADWIVVAESNRELVGYSIWKKPTPYEQNMRVRMGHYSIAAVHPDYSGRGLFSALTYAGMEILKDLCDCIEGPTHINNYGVQRGYTKLNWHICDAHHSFHKWLPR